MMFILSFFVPQPCLDRTWIAASCTASSAFAASTACVTGTASSKTFFACAAAPGVSSVGRVPSTSTLSCDSPS